MRTARWICLAVQPRRDCRHAGALRAADDAGVVDLDAGIARRANRDRQGEALQEREVDVDVEPLRLETGEAGGDGLEALADGIEVVQSLLEAEVGEELGDQLVAQEGGELFVLFKKAFLK